MSFQRHFSLAVADALLSGSWNPHLMQQRVNKALGENPPWLSGLVQRLYQHFTSAGADCTREAIAHFIINDSGFRKVWIEQRQNLHIREYFLPDRAPAKAIVQCDVPLFTQSADLAQWLGLSNGQLQQYSRHWRSSLNPQQAPFRHYHYQWRNKQTGRKRLLEIPKPRLRDAQRQIYAGILRHIPCHEACHGFRRSRSCRTYAQGHSGKQLVMRLDLRNFFVSIRLPRIRALFCAVGYHSDIAELLAGLCCNRTPPDIIAENCDLSWSERQQFQDIHLPQGSSSSPALANLCAYRLDVRLAALAAKLGGYYTRYADDLAFSGNRQFAAYAAQMSALVAHIAADEGFSLNHRKTRVMRKGVCQKLTGIVVNRHVNYSRKHYDRLKATLFNCACYGPETQNRENHPDFRAYLLGRIAYVADLNPVRAEKLQRLFARIDWVLKK